MALINCPECGRQVSTTATSCPNCGYNIKRIVSFCISCETYKNREVLMNYNKEKNILVCPECGRIDTFWTPEQEAQIKENQRIYELQNDNKVTCPYCHSTNVLKIGTGERVASIIGLGIFSKKINKSFKCKNCGGTF